LPTKVLLADAEHLVRAGLRRIIESRDDVEIVAEARDGSEAVARCIETQPDIAILELQLPNLSGVAAIRRIVAQEHAPRCMVISSRETRGYVHQALRAGAMGYLLKSATVEAFHEALSVVKEGRFYLSPTIAHHVVDAFTGGTMRSGDSGLDLLTQRETEVLQLIAEGLSSKEIAAQLGVSPKTAETHRASLMDKLGIHKASSLVRFAIREGLVTA
jgi:DNA-binding NarL/FixJ family response regulator